MISMTPEETRQYKAQLETFERLLARADHLLKKFGKSDMETRDYDFSVLEDYYGHPQIKISVCNLALMRPHIVKQLQELLAAFPGWEIVYTVALPNHLYDWPDMGLYIRGHEIVDTLQRQYFPREFQNLEYESSRRGVEGRV